MKKINPKNNKNNKDKKGKKNLNLMSAGIQYWLFVNPLFLTVCNNKKSNKYCECELFLVNDLVCKKSIYNLINVKYSEPC